MEKSTSKAEPEDQSQTAKTACTKKPEPRYRGLIPSSVPYSFYNVIGSVIVSISLVLALFLLYMLEKAKAMRDEQCIADPSSGSCSGPSRL
jgi:hypothetical protein